MKYTSAVLLKHNNKWRGQISYKDGKTWNKKTKVLQATGKRAAEKELREWQAEMEAEAEQEALIAAGGANPKETVADYVEHYIEGRSNYVEDSSIRGYNGLLRKQINPYIGNIPLDELTPDDIDKWLARLSEDYKPVTVKKAFTLLKSAMTQAVERDRLPKNPTRTIKPPKLPTSKPNALTEKGLQTVLNLLETAELTPALLGVKIAIFTGMRQEEICGLRWRHIDLERQSLHVTEVIGNGRNGYYVKPPKNEKSNREIFYPAELASSLSERKAKMEKECLSAGVPFTSDHYVLGGVDGSFMQPHYLWRKWRELADALDLIGTQGKRLTFHDLRHSYATTAIHNGIDVKTISNSMGHSNAAMTLNTYTSTDDDAQRRAAEAMGNALTSMAKRAQDESKVINIEGTGTEGKQ